MANEVDIVVSDKYVNRGGFGQVQKKMKDLEGDADSLGKKLKGIGDGADAGADKAATSFIGKFSDVIGQAGTKLTGLFANPQIAAAAAPAGALAGAAFGGAVVAGAGAAMVGLGVLAAAQSEAVKSTWRSTLAGIGEDAANIAKPFQRVLTDLARQTRSAFNDVAPSLGKLFENLAPSVSKFASEIFYALKQFAPAVQPIADAFKAVIGDIGGRLPGMVRTLASAFKSLADDVAENPKALGDVIQMVVELTAVLVRAAGVATDLWEGFKSLSPGWNAKEITDDVQALADAQAAAADTTKTHADSLAQLNAKLNENIALLEESINADLSYREAQFAATQATNEIAAAQQGLNDAIRIYGANSKEAKAAQDALTEAQFGGERAALQVAEAARELATANSTAATEEGKAAEGSRAYAQSLFELAAAGNGSAMPALQSILSHMTSADLQALNLTRSTNNLGQAVYSLPNGKTITLQANSAPAQWVIDRFVLDNSGKVIPMTIQMSQIPSGRSPYARASGGVTAGSRDFAFAASGGARGNNVIMNEQGPEAVRLPQGSTVIPAGMTRSLEERWADGGGGSQVVTLEVVGDASKWLVEAIRETVRIKGGGDVQRALGKK